MKTLFIIFLLLTLNLSSNELNWVDEQINAIKPPRKGVSSSTISRLRDPFVLKKKTKQKEVKNSTKKEKGIIPNGMANSSSNKIESKTLSRSAFKISAIMNKSALINGTWYKLNDKIKGYTLSRITTSYVILTKKGKNMLLSTNSNINIKFKNK